jgi:hypothetical protein
MKINIGIIANRKKRSLPYKELEVLTWTFHEETEEKNEKCQSGSWICAEI